MDMHGRTAVYRGGAMEEVRTEELHHRFLEYHGSHHCHLSISMPNTATVYYGKFYVGRRYVGM